MSDNSPNEVFLLGCGRSVLDLQSDEIAYINNAKCVLALNKFLAFYDVVGIIPSHVWFTEIHQGTHPVLAYLFQVCRRDRLKVTFILNERYRGNIFTKHISYQTTHWSRMILWWLRRIYHRKMVKRPPTFNAPEYCTYSLVKLTNWLEGGEWAKSLDDPLFQYRTSFTAALNYLAICFPYTTIKLVGTDFNSKGYFFEKEMRSRGLQWHDWTTQMQVDQGKHFAAIEYQGGTVFDVFPYIREQIEKSGIRITCSNPNSAVIEHGLAEYQSVISTE